MWKRMRGPALAGQLLTPSSHASCQRWRIASAGQRSAVTLIELLIVMGILTILATLSLTTVKGLLRDQKVTQAARLVEQYIESARVRALSNQRPVAVFLERAPFGASDGSLLSTNFTTTRLTIGEVFPPYTGDVLDVSGTLVDIAVNATRPLDGFADQIRFVPAEVDAGFGTNGFISPGDTIEFEGYAGQFPIESISLNSGLINVNFFNPPATYNRASGAVSPSPMPPAIPVSASTPVTTKFRVYRRPSKSLVGGVALPRGTCVDLAASGLGPVSAGGADGSVPFGLAAPPVSGANPRAYSRIAVLFTGEGRLSGVFAEANNGTVKVFSGGQASQILYLMVGRTDQVMPRTELSVDLATVGNRKLSLLQRSAQSDADPIRSNLMDPANVWIVCNPFTGEIKSAPVAQVPDLVLTNAVRGVVNDPNAGIESAVRASRALARSGMREQ